MSRSRPIVCRICDSRLALRLGTSVVARRICDSRPIACDGRVIDADHVRDFARRHALFDEFGHGLATARSCRPVALVTSDWLGCVFNVGKGQVVNQEQEVEVVSDATLAQRGAVMDTVTAVASGVSTAVATVVAQKGLAKISGDKGKSEKKVRRQAIAAADGR